MKYSIALLLVALLALVFAVAAQTTTTTTQPTQQQTATPKSLYTQPKVVQEFVAAINSTLASAKPKALSKVKFLRGMLKNLKSLGLIKSAAEQKALNKQEAAITMKKLVVVAKHLAQLKKEGSTEELNKYVAELKSSKNFTDGVRLVKGLLRKLIRRKVRSLAKKLKVAGMSVANGSKVASVPSKKINYREQFRQLLSRKLTKKPLIKRRSMIKRRTPSKYLSEPIRKRRSIIKRRPLIKRVVVVRYVRLAPRKFGKRYPNRQVRRFPKRFVRPTRRQIRFPKKINKKSSPVLIDSRDIVKSVLKAFRTVKPAKAL